MTQPTSQGRPVRTVRVRGGKEYVEVHERVRIAHEEGGYTTLEPFVYPIGERWFYRAGIIVDGQTFYGTAEIKFGAKPGTADGDAPMECAETSAYGRAFAFAGIGVLDSIASADEMSRGQMRQQATPAKPAPSRQEPQDYAYHVEDHRPPAQAQQAPQAQREQMVSIAQVFERAKRLGVKGAAWNDLKAKCGADVARIIAALDEMEAGAPVSVPEPEPVPAY